MISFSYFFKEHKMQWEKTILIINVKFIYNLNIKKMYICEIHILSIKIILRKLIFK